MNSVHVPTVHIDIFIYMYSTLRVVVNVGRATQQQQRRGTGKGTAEGTGASTGAGKLRQTRHNYCRHPRLE